MKIRLPLRMTRSTLEPGHSGVCPLPCIADTCSAVQPSTVNAVLAPRLLLRELLIPFGHSGYVALSEVEDASTVTILAVRHQLEDDYH